jgi:hypothetical protein
LGKLASLAELQTFPALASVDVHVHASKPVDAQLVAKCTQGGHSAVNAASAGGGSGFVGGKSQYALFHKLVSGVHRGSVRSPSRAKGV